MSNNDFWASINETPDYIETRCNKCRASKAWPKGEYDHNQSIIRKLKVVGYTCGACATKQAKGL